MKKMIFSFVLLIGLSIGISANAEETNELSPETPVKWETPKVPLIKDIKEAKSMAEVRQIIDDSYEHYNANVSAEERIETQGNVPGSKGVNTPLPIEDVDAEKYFITGNDDRVKANIPDSLFKQVTKLEPNFNNNCYLDNDVLIGLNMVVPTTQVLYDRMLGYKTQQVISLSSLNNKLLQYGTISHSYASLYPCWVEIMGKE